MRIVDKIELMRKAIIKEAEDMLEDALIKAQEEIQEEEKKLEEQLAWEKEEFLRELRLKTQKWVNAQNAIILMQERREKDAFLQKLFFAFIEDVKKAFEELGEQEKRLYFFRWFEEALKVMGRQKVILRCNALCLPWANELKMHEFSNFIERVEEEPDFDFGVMLESVDGKERVENTLTTRITEQEQRLQELLRQEVRWS
ncbi:hypothetical protein [Atrimonas thermophila]|jgi:vacuolar-type H+-ATPase subunit E/Vma4|uniref:hypothetical protein n=1 Tax=Atrimonas thermophila TaxID=3064161 RepID=UPI00399CE2ED